MGLAVAAACYHQQGGTLASTRVPTLIGTEWSVVELNGAPAGLGVGDKPATLLLSAADHRVSGFAGCNRAAGTYTLDGSALHIGPLVMTRMACQQGMDLEQRYAAALGATRSYRIDNGQLELLAGDTVVARLK
jgi:heat shock protein HslJ